MILSDETLGKKKIFFEACEKFGLREWNQKSTAALEFKFGIFKSHLCSINPGPLF